MRTAYRPLNLSMAARWNCSIYAQLTHHRSTLQLQSCRAWWTYVQHDGTAALKPFNHAIAACCNCSTPPLRKGHYICIRGSKEVTRLTTTRAEYDDSAARKYAITDHRSAMYIHICTVMSRASAPYKRWYIYSFETSCYRWRLPGTIRYLCGMTRRQRASLKFTRNLHICGIIYMQNIA